jgi:low affinity Fe/Cu permease
VNLTPFFGVCFPRHDPEVQATPGTGEVRGFGAFPQEGKNVAKEKPSFFIRFANWASRKTGSSYAFILAVLVVVVWGVSGPIFHFSDTWQLVINTGTTIVTFLMVFLIQNSQNRDGTAVQIKLDELLRSMEGAHNILLDLEKLDDEALDEHVARYRKLAEDARAKRQRGEEDVNAPESEPECGDEKADKPDDKRD